MAATTNTDYLIVGQGLSGSLLAHALLARGCSVKVLDNHNDKAASAVAAGLINPITGHRWNLTENFGPQFEVAVKVYSELAKQHGRRFLHTVQQRRLVKNSGQASYLQKRLAQSDYTRYLGELEAQETVLKNQGFGCVNILQSHVVDVPPLLQAIKKELIAKQSYYDLEFDHSALLLNDQLITYAEYTAKAIIFCEGYQAINNPWLKHLPFKLAKGDVLTLGFDDRIYSNQLYNWGHWLSTSGDSATAKLGSTYDWNESDPRPCEQHSSKLLKSLGSFTHLGVPRVLSHVSGIRPTTTHRTPFIGEISGLPNSYCFNGFGSKGCLTIPYHAELLVDHLELNKPLPTAVTQWL